MGEVVPMFPADPVTKKKREGKPLRTLRTYLTEQKAAGKKAIPEGHRVFEYAREIGLPRGAGAPHDDYLMLAWFRFKDKYTDPDGQHHARKYRDWPAVFLTAVKENWMKVWYRDAGTGEYGLTTPGQQAQQSMKKTKS